MSKIFTIQVPDQLWVDTWNTNKTESYTYSGPDTLYVLISGNTNSILDWAKESIEAGSSSNNLVVEIDATDNNNLPLAHFLYSQGVEHNYITEDETNHDGSIYQKITNPLIHNYFELRYNKDDGLYLSPIYKNSKTIAEEKAEKRLEYVKKYLNVYDFDAETQVVIDKFLSDMTAYTTSIATVYPWKYITIDENEIPKIPSSLVSVFNTLPEIE